MRIPRRETIEQEWLELAELEAGSSGFAAHALRRLAAGDELYGDQWACLPLERLIDELAEEAADLGSWGVLALERLEHVEMSAAHRDLISATLQAVILWAAYAHKGLSIARIHAGTQVPQ